MNQKLKVFIFVLNTLVVGCIMIHVDKKIFIYLIMPALLSWINTIFGIPFLFIATVSLIVYVGYPNKDVLYFGISYLYSSACCLSMLYKPKKRKKPKWKQEN